MSAVSLKEGLFDHIQSIMYIEGTRGNLKICPLRAVALYIQVKKYMQYSLIGN